MLLLYAVAAAVAVAVPVIVAIATVAVVAATIHHFSRNVMKGMVELPVTVH